MKFTIRILLSAYFVATGSTLWATPKQEIDLNQKASVKPIVSPRPHRSLEAHIFSFLEQKDLRNVAATCKHWREIALQVDPTLKSKHNLQAFSLEVIQHIFSFTHMKDFDALTLTSSRLAIAARDERGPFKDFFEFQAEFSKHYDTFKAASNESLFESFATFLGQVRAQSTMLSHRPCEDQMGFAQLLLAHLKQNIQTILQAPRPECIKPLLASIALVRAWDTKLSSQDLTWFEDQIRELHQLAGFNEVQVFPYVFPEFPGDIITTERSTSTENPNKIQQQFNECLILNRNTAELYNYFFNYSADYFTPKTKLALFASELSHRGKEAALVVCVFADMYQRFLNNKALALQLYDSALTTNNAFPVRVFLNAALCALELQQWKQAAHYYKIAIEKDPNLDGKIYVKVAECYALLNDWAQAAHYYKIAIEKNPDLDAQSYVAAAECCFKLEDWAQAAHYCKIAIEKYPDLGAGIYINLGLCYFQLEDWEQAVRCYLGAIEKNSNLGAKIYAQLAECYAKLNNWAQAAHYYKIALEKDPNLNAQYYVKVAECYIILNDWAQAAHYFKSAIEKNPDLNPQTYARAAECYIMLNDWAQAAHYYQVTFEKSSKLGAGIYANAGLCYFMLEEWKKAAYYYEIALEIDPALGVKIYTNTKLCYLLCRNSAKAVKYYKILFKKYPILAQSPVLLQLCRLHKVIS